MVWGAFCADGMLELAFPSTKMNSAEYTALLQTNRIPFFDRNRDKNMIFQQNNADIHKSNHTRMWLESHNIPQLQWPACSPDQNPIEKIWGIMVRKVYGGNKQYDTIGDLKAAVIEAWEAISNDVRFNLINCMPQRIFELILNKGGPTHY